MVNNECGGRPSSGGRRPDPTNTLRATIFSWPKEENEAEQQRIFTSQVRKASLSLSLSKKKLSFLFCFSSFLSLHLFFISFSFSFFFFFSSLCLLLLLLFFFLRMGYEVAGKNIFQERKEGEGTQ